MEQNSKTTFIVVCGVFVLMVFTYVATMNLLPDSVTSDAYYAKIDKDMVSSIESVEIDKGILTIKTNGEPAYYCVKTTKSTPTEKSLCWNKVENNIATMSVFEGKHYYVWIKDVNNKISSPKSIELNLTS